MNTIQTLGRRVGHAHERQQPPQMAMQKNALLSIAKPLGSRIDCIRGCLWLTRDGDPVDTILSAGEHWVAEGRPRLIVQALEVGIVRISGRGISVQVR